MNRHRITLAVHEQSWFEINIPGVINYKNRAVAAVNTLQKYTNKANLIFYLFIPIFIHITASKE
jgi:hypothetical protein